MLKQPSTKYRAFAPIRLSNRTCPDAVLTRAPLWCRAYDIEGQGNGPIKAFINGAVPCTGHDVRVLDYHENALRSGANARAISYVELRVDEQRTLFGVGIDAHIVAASFKAVASALARARFTEQEPLQILPPMQALELNPAVFP